MKESPLKIDKEFIRFALAFSTFAIFSILTGWKFGYVPAGIFVALIIFSAYFFRDPPRTAPEDENAVLSPADGRVVFVGITDDPALGKVHRVAVFMSLWDVHVCRSPAGGIVELLDHRDGGYFRADSPESASRNESQDLFIRSEFGPLGVRLIAGKIARRILVRVSRGDEMFAGQRIGLIRFGSRAEILVPVESAEPAVKKGDRVRAGESVLARWKISP